jgi:excisionase family DNA binding protein
MNEAVKDRTDLREVLSVEEARVVLGLGRRAAYAGVKRGEIPSIRVGRRLLVPRVALDKLLSGGDG